MFFFSTFSISVDGTTSQPVNKLCSFLTPSLAPSSIINTSVTYGDISIHSTIQARSVGWTNVQYPIYLASKEVLVALETVLPHP